MKVMQFKDHFLTKELSSEMVRYYRYKCPVGTYDENTKELDSMGCYD